MPEAESFDAFYARTVGSITEQMHALAGADSAADHGVREAYARAYQQWYEVSGYPDPEGWVLAAAREAYQRRRPEAMPRLGEPATAGRDSLSWPGLYRPAPGGPALGPAPPVAEPVADVSGESTIGVMSAPAGTTTALGSGHQAPPGWLQPPRLPGRPGRSGPGTSMLVLTAAIAVILAGVAVYLAVQRHSPNSANHATTSQNSHEPTMRMLGLGKVGTLSQVPWSLVGPGWTLAEVSSAPAASPQAGPITTFLVDPEGGRYRIQTDSPGSIPQLLAWSGDHNHALYAVPAASSAAGASYEILSLITGTIAPLPLPAHVTAVGFSRPDGQNILAVSHTSTAFRLQRYSLEGKLQRTIGTMPRKPDAPKQFRGCTVEWCALSSPDGKTDVWGVVGDRMQLVGNAGGLIRRLDVPDSGTCVPLTWWDTATVLSYCRVTDQPSAARLWLVPANGGTPTALTGIISGSSPGFGVLTGAWQAPGNGAYVTMTTAQQCAGAASGPGLILLRLQADRSLQPVSIRGTTGNHNSIVSAVAGRILLLAQTSCPGPSSLIWLNPSTGATTTVLTAPAGQAGVLAAVPEGIGPPATSTG